MEKVAYVTVRNFLTTHRRPPTRLSFVLTHHSADCFVETLPRSPGQDVVYPVVTKVTVSPHFIGLDASSQHEVF